ncbi:hypothetical protein FRC15_011218 [Serendipita sp. 397]|nr:hypothetical protein FRC15_011218 [Serendipita sp. 397]
MTNDACQTFCDQAGFTIAATEWSQECWCDNDFQFGDTALPEECDHMCSGNPTEVCGGSGRLTVWTKSSTATVLESYGDWTSQGCFIDSMAARVVPVFMPLDAPFTPQRCLDACSSSGYLYAGLEYRLECYCANSVDIASLTSTPIEECASTCEGDASHYCGAGNRLILYQKPENAPISYGDWTGKGCYTDSIGDRVLPNRVYVDGAMTIEKCTNKCLESGFPYAGVEFGDVSRCLKRKNDVLFEPCRNAIAEILLELLGHPPRMAARWHVPVQATKTAAVVIDSTYSNARMPRRL